MKIKRKKSFRSIKDVHDVHVDLVEYITRELDGDDYDRGALESARATADNASRMLGKLIDVLATKKILRKNDLSELLGEDIELIKEGGSRDE